MATYRIICTTQEPSQLPNDLAHIVAVGTGTSTSSYDQYWQLSEVLAAMDGGDNFYTLGETSRRTVAVENTNAPGAHKPIFDQLLIQ